VSVTVPKPIVLSERQVRRLALVKAGLLRPQWLGLPSRSRSHGRDAVGRAHQVVGQFGYLQLDTVSIAGARTQGIVLASRLDGFAANTVEGLLRPGQPLFEYWGHEACWLPMDMYPIFAFRRREFHVHPWWGDLLANHKRIAQDLLDRARSDGPFRSIDLEGERRDGWWNIKLAKRIAEALWSAGALVISERRNFQRIYDLPERVIPAHLLNQEVPADEAYKHLLVRALRGHGFATTGLLAATWRLRNRRPALEAALQGLMERGEIVAATLDAAGKRTQGWLLSTDLELIDKADALRIHAAKGVLLSPFDPILWDRARVAQLFGFEQLLEIYKPAAQRQYGYYCLPVLAGERLIGRVDLKARRTEGLLQLLACHVEPSRARDVPRHRQAIQVALERFAAQVGLELRSRDSAN
jgi:uncharacterized protein